MICESIEFTDFRNISSARIELSPGINVLFGNNAEGKTNAAEGIYLFSCGRSFRAHSDAEIVKFGEKSCSMKLIYSGGGYRNRLEFSVLPSGKRLCRKNGAPVSRLSEFVGNFHAVLFCPEHLSIVKEGPSVRRGFLDMALSQLSPLYLSTLQRYHSVLRQRNSLLKQRLFSGKWVDSDFSDSVDVWSVQLASAGAYIARARFDYVERLNNKTALILRDMSEEKDGIELSYTEPQEESVCLERLRSSLEREIKMGMTLTGIHRDDMIVRVNGRDARSYASQGQQRSSALSMKLAEGEIIREEIGEYPVFLLDDILSELDGRRREYILGGLSDRQVIITSCGDDIGGDKRFFVSGGSYTPV